MIVFVVWGWIFVVVFLSLLMFVSFLLTFFVLFVYVCVFSVCKVSLCFSIYIFTVLTTEYAFAV